MAIIYTYPEINQVEGEDLLLISDTSLHKRPTRSVTVNDLALYIGIGFWKLGTAPDSIFTTKMTSVGQDANIANSKFNVYKTEDMVTSVPHVATFNESSSNHSANLWPSPGDNSADIYGSVSRATFTGSGTVDQIIGSNPIGRHSGSGNVNFIQGAQTTASLTGSGSTDTIIASYNKTFIQGTGSNNISTAIGSWNVAELNGLNDVDTIYGTYSNVVLTRGDVNDDAIGHFIDFDQVSADTEVNNAYYIHAKNDSLSVTGEKFFIKDETGIPSQFSNKLVLNAYGSGTFTGTATQRLAVDTSGNVIEIPIGSGPVDGSGTANYTARWIDTDTLGIGALYDNGTNVGIGTTSPDYLFEVEKTTSGSATLASFKNTENTGIRISRTGTSPGTSIFNVVNNGALYTSSDSHIAFQPGNSTSVFMQSTGNVGIGTTNPSAALEVVGGIKLSDNSPLTWATSNTRIFGQAGYMQFQVGSTDKMRITSSGNVGIGTTSPSAKLEIAGTGNQKLLVNRTDGDNFFIDAQNGQIRLRGSSNIYMGVGSDVLTVTNTNVGIGTTSPSSKFQVSVNDGDGITLKHGASNAFYILRDGSDDTIIKQTRNYTSKISISTLADSGTHESSGLNIVGQGVGLKSNVGIGTASPSEKLEVAGNIKVDKGTTNRTAYLSDDGLYISRSTIANSYPNSIIADPGNSNNLDINARSRISLKLNTNTVLIANDAGNVGIGTTGPGYPLEVNGIIKTSTSFLGTTAIIQKVTALNTNGIQFANNGGSEKMRITDAGNVGIGTNNPTTPLHVKADAPSIRLEDNTSGDNHYLTGNNGEFRVQSTGYITIRPGNTVSTRFDANGNVGIGTTSPLSKLNVNGDIKIEGENELYFGSSGSVPLWEIKASGSDLVINDTGSNVGSVLFNNDEGVVLPRLTTTEINAISLPNTGLTVYNTTLNTLCFYNGSSWQKVSHTNM